ncbi:hydrolase [Philodulcilactobacillus myokoensis]|uniref:Hydrolase n=1 Tax=Philodulcilactobacillus myokoensis TaxID=2929573 RepID=A0A9W6B2U0_9LACO|nr:alpha/beta hydrolase [Philodulcilactobacillus myokoensis]GLB47325.1 hydrolase [Philodulcilactobacillus myokoensis]
MHTSKKVFITILLLIECFIFILTIGWQFRGSALNHVKVQQRSTATVFCPGYGGNAVSTDDFIEQFNTHRIARRALRIYVDTNNHISTMHKYHKVANNNPLVQLIFKDNTHPNRQANQMPYVMRYLYKVYHIKSVNLIGHSSGGNIGFDYMLNHPNLKDVPKVNKFVSIAANYKIPDRKVKNLPKNLKILNIAGEIYNLGTDGEVPVKTVSPMKKLVDGHVASYQFYVYRSNPLAAEHSMLHENPQLDKVIAEFLFNE